MVYGLEYELDTQIETNTFVNGDYETMSNSMVRYYTGPRNHSLEEMENNQEPVVDEDFLKWLL